MTQSALPQILASTDEAISPQPFPLCLSSGEEEMIL